MEEFSGTIAVVTGASGGIGAAIVSKLVANRMTVVGFARNLEKMEELKGNLKESAAKFYPLKVDITKTDEIREAFHWIRINLGTVHVLVNNAGCMAIGKLIDGDPELWRYTFDLNVVGLITCAQEAVQLMEETQPNKGLIINMNSTAGHHVPFYNNPRLNVYPASKFAVTAVNQTLHQELRYRGSRIRVTSISPGYVDTGFALRARGADKISDEIKTILGAQPSLTPEDVAENVFHVISLPNHIQIDEIVLTAV